MKTAAEVGWKTPSMAEFFYIFFICQKKVKGNSAKAFLIAPLDIRTFFFFSPPPPTLIFYDGGGGGLQGNNHETGKYVGSCVSFPKQLQNLQ